MAPYTGELMSLFVVLVWITTTLFVLRKLQPDVPAGIGVGVGWRVFDLHLNRTSYYISAIPFGFSYDVDQYPASTVIAAALVGSLVTALSVEAIAAAFLLGMPYSAPTGLIEPNATWTARLHLPIAPPAVVIGVDGQVVTSRSSLATLLGNRTANHRLFVTSVDARHLASIDVKLTASEAAAFESQASLRPYIEVSEATEAASKAGLKRGDLIFEANGQLATTASRLSDIFTSGFGTVKLEGISSQLRPFVVWIRRNERPRFHSDFGLKVRTTASETIFPNSQHSIRSVLQNQVTIVSNAWRGGSYHVPLTLLVTGGENAVLAATTSAIAVIGPLILLWSLPPLARFIPWMIPAILLLHPGYRWWAIPAFACIPVLNRFSRESLFLVWIFFVSSQLWSVESAWISGALIQEAKEKNVLIEWMI